MQDTSSALLHAATLTLAVFAVLAIVDGVYVHLIYLKLHLRRSSALEHIWHTLGAILAAPGLYAVFAVVSGGRLLWFGIAVTGLGQVVEWLDMISEKQSRAPLGGLSSAEYILHLTISATRNVAFALALAARPASAFSLTSPNVVGSLDEPYRTLVWLMLPGAAALAFIHLWLACRRWRSDLAAV